MSLSGQEEPSNLDQLPPDPLLKPGAFIDPPGSATDLPGPTVHPSSPANIPPEAPPSADQKSRSDPPPADGSLPAARPDWLPPGWKFVEKVRSSGASAGSRDKYYLDPVSNHRFRSKKEVLFFLETGTPKGKRKNANSDVDGLPQTNSETPKRKKSESKAKNPAKYFNFDDVPTKVKWVLTDVYEGMWRPLMNGVDRVPESAKQEWSAAFTYLTLQNNGRPSF